MDRRAVVVGAGPAGLSAACALLRAGFEATVLEQQRSWQGRVCGGFINPEGVTHLAWLGVLDELRAAGGTDVGTARLTVAGNREGLVPVTRDGVPGLGVSRQSLERVLAERVAREGGDLRRGVRATLILREGDRWRITGRTGASDAESLTGALVVLADGRFSPARVGGPAVAERRPGRVEGWYGWNASFEGVSQRAGDLSMHFYPGGYVGVLTFADGETNVCGLVERRAADVGPWERVWVEALERQPSLRAMTDGARRVSPWRGVGPLPFGRTVGVQKGLLAAGDAGGVGDPYMGEGISRALGSGRLLYEVAVEVRDRSGEIRADLLAARYARAWRRHYAPRLRLGWIIRQVQERPRFFDRTLGLLLRQPSTLHALSAVFHG